MRVPFVDLESPIAATESAWRERLAALRARSIYILGPEGAAFEPEFAAAMGAREAVAVGSGSAAIEIALRDHRIPAGREVLTTALTAPFTAVSIRAAGLTPAFADIDPETLQIDPDDAAGRLNKRTAAIVPVHLYGQPCRIDRISKLAKQSGLAVVQDACQAHGAKFLGKHDFTRYSRHVAYSFYPTKNLGALGDGGAIATNSATAAQRLRRLRDGGRRGGQVSHGDGINSRLDEMQACYLRAFLPHLGAWNERRREIARRYDERLAGVPGVTLVKRYPCSVCHLYVIRAQRRDRLRAFLDARGVGSGIHYPVPLHLHPAFSAKLRRGDLPHAEKACREIVSLPIGPFLADDAVDHVAEAVGAFYR